METEFYCRHSNSTFYGHFMTNECDMTTMTFNKQRNSSFSSRGGYRLHFMPTEFLFFKSLCPSFFSSSSRHRPSSIFVTSSLTSKMIFVLFCVFLVFQSFVPTTGEYYFCNLNKRGGERLCSRTSIDLRF